MKKQQKKKNKKQQLTLVSTSVAVVASVASPMGAVVAEASAGSQQVTFSESFSSTQSKTITIPNLESIESITSDTGNVTYTRNGDQLTITVSGGTPSRSVWDADYYSKTASGSRTSSSQTGFASTISYSDAEGYSGTLSQSGSPTVISGVYTPSASYTETETRTSSTNSFPSTISYNSGGYTGTLSKSGSVTSRVVSGTYTPASSKTIVDYAPTSQAKTDYFKYLGGGDFAYDHTTPTSVPATKWYSSGGYEGNLNRVFKNTSAITRTQPSNPVVGGIYGIAHFTSYYDFEGTVTKPAVDTRVYEYTQNYSGTVTKPASDTRTWEQDYSGTVYKGKTINYYSYDVTINYTTDSTPPVAPTITPSTTSPTNGNVTATISYPSDAVTKEYSLNDGAWTPYTTALTLTANGKIEARATDRAGNVSTITTYNVTNIDKTAPTTPTFSPSTTSPTNANVSVTVNYPSDASVKEYSLNDGAWTPYTGAISMADNGKIEARAKDVAGNYSSIGTYNVTNIDKVAPTSPVITPSTTLPTNQDVSVSIAYPTDSTLDEYRINGGAWTTYSTAVTMTANGKVEARAKDQAGNYSTIVAYNVTNIDKTAPTNPTFTSSMTAPTNQNVTVTLNFPADGTVKQYKIGATGTWTAYTTPVVLSANNTIYARGYDAVGNETDEVTFSVTNIDKIAPNAPTVSANITAPTNDDVVVTATYPSDALIKQYRVNGGSWTSYTAPVTMTANGTFEVRAIDNAGNISGTTSYSVTNIDKTPPVTATLTPNTTAPTNQNVTVSIAYPADATTKQYKIGSTGAWTSYSTPVSVSANTTIYARSHDAVGNISAESTLVVSNIDKVAPTTPSLSADITNPTNTDVDVTISYPSDAQMKEYRVDGGSWQAYNTAITLTKNGVVEARGTDNAGNVSTVGSLTVSNIDKVAPVQATFTPSKSTPTNTDITVSISYPNDAHVKEYRKDGGSWTAYTTAIPFSTNGKVEARSIDNAGNVSAVSSYSVTNIDKVAPNVPTFSADRTQATNHDVAVTVSFPSDAHEKLVRVNNGTWVAYTSPITFTQNGIVEAKAVDNAGNTSAVVTYNVTNIDKVKPLTATLTASETKPTNQDLQVSASFPADVVTKEYRKDNDTWTPYTTPVTFSQNGTVEVRGWDNAGNVSDVATYNVTNIDKVAPIQPSMAVSQTNPTNQDVAVSVTFASDSALKQVRKDGGEWVNYTAPIVFADNGELEARSIDSAGNISTVSTYQIENIDKVAPNSPTVKADKTNPTNTDVVVTASFPTDAHQKLARINDGSWTAYTSPITFEQNGKIEVKSVDIAGNHSAITTYEVTNIDKVKPVTATFQPNQTAPTNQDVVVSVTFPSDVVKKEVKVNNGTWVAYTDAITMTDNGVIEVRGTDNAGNTSDVSRYEVNNIDRVAPKNPTQTVITNQNKITLSGDRDSKTYYRINDGAWKEYTNAIVTEDGTYKVDIKSIDPASNESEVITFHSTMYRDALATAVTHVEEAESVQTQESVNLATAKVQAMPHDVPEYQPLMDRLADIQALIDARVALEKALETRNEADVQDAKEKIDLLDNGNPIIIDLLDEVEAEFEVADILALVAKERWDILLSRYGMSKVAYNSLVQSYYAIKYIGDNMYKLASEKVVLVPESDKYYELVQEQYNNLNIDYDQFVEDRIATDAEIKAESSVKVMESNYDPSYALNTQSLIDAVEDATIRASLQQRLDTAKAKYETSQLAKSDQNAIASVEKAESTKQTYYVTEAYKKVNALTNEVLKSELTTRLQTLEAQMTLDRKISDATRTVELAEQYKYQSYIDSAQNKVSALPDGDVKTSLQARIDAVKSGLSTGDQSTIITKAKNALSLAISLRTQYYVDKAQTAINLVEDATIKAELQAKLDAIVVK